MTALAARSFEKQVYRRVSFRLMPFLFLCYIFAYLDRVNVGFAKLQMQQDLKISDAAYGFGAGIFFIGYFFFEIPCNLALQKIGAKRWLGPIMIVWGLVSACTLFVKTETEFYTVRFILGLVESGFFPGVILYLTFWYPSSYRAKMVATFMAAVPLSGVIGGPISGWILERANSLGGLRGWQWLFLFEAVPSLLAGVAALILLHDSPAHAQWLKAEERDLLIQRLRDDTPSIHKSHSLTDAFRNPRVWVLCFVYFGFVMGNYGLGFWLPQIVKDTLTKDPLQIGFLTAIPWGVSVFSMIFVGQHSDATGERCWHIALAGIVGAIAFAASAIPGIPGSVGLFALTVATAGIVAAYSTFWALPTSILSGTAASAGIAWINSVGNVSGWASPFFIGVIRDATHNMMWALVMLASSSLGAALLTIIFFRKQRPRQLA